MFAHWLTRYDPLSICLLALFSKREWGKRKASTREGTVVPWTAYYAGRLRQILLVDGSACMDLTYPVTMYDICRPSLRPMLV
jgi:hypothetical protein